MTAFRARILAAADSTSYAELEQKLKMAEQEMYWLRLAGDAVVAAFFAGDKAPKREHARRELSGQLEQAIRKPSDFSLVQPVEDGVAKLRIRLAPFHWELEFPEVFRSGGFDAIVGNPPFAGKNTLLTGNIECYLDWLKTLHEEAHGNSDLVAHFFRRAFTLLKPDGCFGLIATNTIGQGDTRSTGLRWIATNGGTIYRGRKRLPWPGEAAVVVSVVHVAHAQMRGPFVLDGRVVPIITAYLFHAGGSEDPLRLHANEGKSFIGSYVLGMGFTFDDTDRKGEASSLAEMERLIAKDPRNAERVFPYIGGEEVNDSPTHAHHRYVINFEDYPLRRDDVGGSWAKSGDAARKRWLSGNVVPLDYPGPVAADWPDLLAIVERKVKPDRQSQGSIVNPARWWMFARPGTELGNAVSKLDSVLALSRVSSHLALASLKLPQVFAETTVVMASDSRSLFSILQSRSHESWARFFSSSLEDRLRYAPSDCFETFPFPPNFESSASLEEAGHEYYEYRAQLMVRTNKGLTATYNWFHDRDSDEPEITRLRELHDAMDRAVLDAYGWPDLAPTCEFIREFEDAEEDDDSDTGRPRRKRFRYRWVNEIRDEVLARLLELNRLRALEEGQIPVRAEQPKRPKPKKAAAPKPVAVPQDQFTLIKGDSNG